MAFFMLVLLLNAWIIPNSVHGNGNTDSVTGLSFHPVPPKQDSYENTLIWYKHADAENVKLWTEKLDNFLEVYKNVSLQPGGGQNKMACDYDQPPSAGKVCDVDIHDWHPCTQENHYNFKRGAPCVFLKLNNVLGWRPDFYNDSLPDNMPSDLKNFIQMNELRDRKYLNTVWVSCDGENPADAENIGPIQYIPRRGFPGYYFPFTNTEGYLSPLVAIYFERPMNGIVISVECKIWARNVVNSEAESQGSVHFELLID